MSRRLATIDLGTNTVRLLIVEAEGSRWRALHQDQRVTRLGEGQATAGRLLDAPMQRTIDTVSEFVRAAERLGVPDVYVVATSAVREASNREAFVVKVATATGRPVRVVSGLDEARLTLYGVAAGLPRLEGSFTLFDIGGGSTELVVARQGRPLSAASLPLGVVALRERYMDEGPVDATRFALLEHEVTTRLAEGLPPALVAAAADSTLVGTAGTVTTLAALDLGLSAYDAMRVHGHVLTLAAVDGLLTRLAPMTLAERARLPSVEPGRADVLVPGIAICRAVLGRLGRDALVVSDRGLREGILEELLTGG